ncbi:MAG: hypothetical protein AB7P17_08350 [Nitrospirales bacterium]|nr:Slp family lipoprotein [Nitrospirales bacterium]
MRKEILLLGVVGLVSLQSGCATSPGSDLLVPKGNEDKMVIRDTQFEEMAGNSSKYQGRTVLLAGAIVSIDETNEGYQVLAEWLPYPKRQSEEGPKAIQSDEHRHFLIRFVGKRDREFYTIRGNKFLLEGTVEGTKQGLGNLFGPKQDLLYINAKCVHIWETGEANIGSSQGDSEYPPARERTLCAD